METTPSLPHQDITAAALETQGAARPEVLAEHDDWRVRRPEDRDPAVDARLSAITGLLPSWLDVSRFRQPAFHRTRPSRHAMSWPDLAGLLSRHFGQENEAGTTP